MKIEAVNLEPNCSYHGQATLSPGGGLKMHIRVEFFTDGAGRPCQVKTVGINGPGVNARDLDFTKLFNEKTQTWVLEGEDPLND